MIRTLLILLAAVLLLAAFELHFTTYAGITGVGPEAVDIASHTDYEVRNGLVVLNLLLAGAAVGIYLVALGRALFFGRRTDDLVVGAILTFLIFFVGWSLVPFWLDRAYQAYLQQEFPSDFIPRDYVPMTLRGFWTGVAVLAITGPMVLLLVRALAAIINKYARPWG